MRPIPHLTCGLATRHYPPVPTAFQRPVPPLCPESDLRRPGDCAAGFLGLLPTCVGHALAHVAYVRRAGVRSGERAVCRGGTLVVLSRLVRSRRGGHQQHDLLPDHRSPCSSMWSRSSGQRWREARWQRRRSRRRRGRPTQQPTRPMESDSRHSGVSDACGRATSSATTWGCGGATEPLQPTCAWARPGAEVPSAGPSSDNIEP